MQRSRYKWMSAALATLVAVSGCETSTPLVNTRPGFIETACELPGVQADDKHRVRCGFVEVPRSYDASVAGQVRISVTIIRSERQPAQPDPVVLLPGGPGFSLTRLFAGQMSQPGFPLGLTRDVVMVDVRGSGLSEPVTCPGYLYLDGLPWLAADLTIEGYSEAMTASFQACIDEARARGVSPVGFGTAEYAQDVERVRAAIGVSQWNVIGTSYDSNTGLYLLARHPKGIRSMVLDSPALIGKLSPLYFDQRVDRAVDALLLECMASEVCVREYPSLEADIDRALAKLQAAPLRIELPANLGVVSNVAWLNRGDLEYLMFAGLYERATISALPAMIKAVNEGRSDALAEPLVNASRRFTGIASYIAMMTHCRDDGVNPAMLRLQPAHPLAGYQVFIPDEACVGVTVEAPEAARDTHVPTLVLSGMLDPIVAPINAHVTAGMLGPNARVLVFPSLGHGVGPQHPCAVGIINAFFERPGATLDTSCIQGIKPVEFRSAW